MAALLYSNAKQPRFIFGLLYHPMACLTVTRKRFQVRIYLSHYQSMCSLTAQGQSESSSGADVQALLLREVCGAIKRSFNAEFDQLHESKQRDRERMEEKISRVKDILVSVG